MKDYLIGFTVKNLNLDAELFRAKSDITAMLVLVKTDASVSLKYDAEL